MKKLISILLVCLIAASSVVLAYADDDAPEVPQIRVTTVEGNGNTIQKADGYVTADISIKDTDGSLLEDAVSFKVRGNSTAMVGISKKAFTFKFSKKKNVLNMGKGKKWAMLANTFDPTLMRNYIAFDLAQKLGLEYTSNQRVVELWVDDVFKGCYLLLEPVQAGGDRVDIETENGDFMLELEASRAEDDVTYFYASGIRFAVSEPETPTQEELNNIKSTMNDIVSAIRNKDREAVEEKIDINSFVKYYILNEYVKPLDFNFSSVFFYYKNNKLYAGPPWDYDVSLGNINKDFSANAASAYNPENLYTSDMHLYSLLTRCDWFEEEAKKAFRDNFNLFTDIYSGGGVIDKFLADYQNVINRNYTDAGWYVNRYWVNIQKVPLKTYDENLAYLREWCELRTRWIAGYCGIEMPTETTLPETEPTSETASPTETTQPTETAEHAETTEATEPETTEPLPLMGDVNLDNTVNVKDATELQKYLAALIQFSKTQLSVADTNRDGSVNIKDVTVIQRFVAKLIEII